MSFLRDLLAIKKRERVKMKCVEADYNVSMISGAHLLMGYRYILNIVKMRIALHVWKGEIIWNREWSTTQKMASQC